MCWHTWEREPSTQLLSFWCCINGMFFCIFQTPCIVSCGFSIRWERVSCCNDLKLIVACWRALFAFFATGVNHEGFGIPSMPVTESGSWVPSWKRDEALMEHIGTTAVAILSLYIEALYSTHMWETTVFAGSTTEVCSIFLSSLDTQLLQEYSGVGFRVLN